MATKWKRRNKEASLCLQKSKSSSKLHIDFRLLPGGPVSMKNENVQPEEPDVRHQDGQNDVTDAENLSLATSILHHQSPADSSSNLSAISNARSKVKAKMKRKTNNLKQLFRGALIRTKSGPENKYDNLQQRNRTTNHSFLHERSSVSTNGCPSVSLDETSSMQVRDSSFASDCLSCRTSIAPVHSVQSEEDSSEDEFLLDGYAISEVKSAASKMITDLPVISPSSSCGNLSTDSTSDDSALAQKGNGLDQIPLQHERALGAMSLKNAKDPLRCLHDGEVVESDSISEANLDEYVIQPGDIKDAITVGGKSTNDWRKVMESFLVKDEKKRGRVLVLQVQGGDSVEAVSLGHRRTASDTGTVGYVCYTERLFQEESGTVNAATEQSRQKNIMLEGNRDYHSREDKSTSEMASDKSTFQTPSRLFMNTFGEIRNLDSFDDEHASIIRVKPRLPPQSSSSLRNISRSAKSAPMALPSQSTKDVGDDECSSECTGPNPLEDDELSLVDYFEKNAVAIKTHQTNPEDDSSGGGKGTEILGISSDRANAKRNAFVSASQLSSFETPPNKASSVSNWDAEDCGRNTRAFSKRDRCKEAPQTRGRSLGTSRAFDSKSDLKRADIGFLQGQRKASNGRIGTGDNRFSSFSSTSAITSQAYFRRQSNRDNDDDDDELIEGGTQNELHSTNQSRLLVRRGQGSTASTSAISTCSTSYHWKKELYLGVSRDESNVTSSSSVFSLQSDNRESVLLTQSNDRKWKNFQKTIQKELNLKKRSPGFLEDRSQSDFSSFSGLSNESDFHLSEESECSSFDLESIGAMTTTTAGYGKPLNQPVIIELKDMAREIGRNPAAFVKWLSPV